MKDWHKPEFWIALGLIFLMVLLIIFACIQGWCATSGTCR